MPRAWSAACRPDVFLVCFLRSVRALRSRARGPRDALKKLGESYMKRLWIASMVAAMLSGAYAANAAEPAACRNVRFADVGWTDIAATTGLASTVLQGLGYNPTKTIAS